MGKRYHKKYKKKGKRGKRTYFDPDYQSDIYAGFSPTPSKIRLGKKA